MSCHSHISKFPLTNFAIAIISAIVMNHQHNHQITIKNIMIAITIIKSIMTTIIIITILKVITITIVTLPQFAIMIILTMIIIIIIIIIMILFSTWPLSNILLRPLPDFSRPVGDSTPRSPPSEEK